MRKGINFEHNLDILVNTLQGEIYDLTRRDKDRVGYNADISDGLRAQGISKTIEYINQQFDKNYESNTSRILGHYEESLQKKTVEVIPSEK